MFRVLLLIVSMSLSSSPCFATDTVGDLGFLDDFFGGFFESLGNALLTVCNWLLDGLILVIGYAAYTIFDGLLSIADGLFASIGLASMLGTSLEQALNLPDAALWFLNQVGFFTALGIIIPAIVIRKIIDVIPGGWQV